MKKPIMQDIADALSVSRISVWKALNNRTGVSEKLREKVFKTAEQIGYLRDPTYGAKNVKASVRTIAAVVSRIESSVFWMQIIHQIAKELSSQGVNLMYIYMPARYNKDDALPAALSDGSVSGIIVINIYSEPQLKMIAKLNLPKVFLDCVPGMPFEQLNGDLILIEGRYAVRQITGRLLDSGIKKLGFVGDIQYAQTNMDRFLGFVDAYAERKLQYDLIYSMIERLDSNSHYQQIKNFLNSLKTMPDGFVCASDYIAHLIQRYIAEYNIGSGRIVLTGFDNAAEFANIANRIITADVRTSSVGERLANKILFAVNHPGVSHEVCYISSRVIYR